MTAKQTGKTKLINSKKTWHVNKPAQQIVQLWQLRWSPPLQSCHSCAGFCAHRNSLTSQTKVSHIYSARRSLKRRYLLLSWLHLCTNNSLLRNNPRMCEVLFVSPWNLKPTYTHIPHTYITHTTHHKSKQEHKRARLKEGNLSIIVMTIATIRVCECGSVRCLWSYSARRNVVPQFFFKKNEATVWFVHVTSRDRFTWRTFREPQKKVNSYQWHDDSQSHVWE